MAHDVFISHSTQDKAVADAACAKLEARGIRCWMAPRDILPSMDWGEAIVDAIGGAKVMVLIFSNHSNTSDQVKREVQNAVGEGVAILPFRIEDVTPIKSLRYFLGTQHWLDALTAPLEQHLDRLADTVSALLEKMTDTPTVEAGAKATRPGQAPPPRTPAPSLPQAQPPAPGPAQPAAGAQIITPAAPVIEDMSIRTLSGHTTSVEAVAVTPDGTRAVSASRDRTVRVWGLETGQALQTLSGHADEVLSMIVTPDGTRAISGSADGTPRVWDLQTGQLLRTLTGHMSSNSVVTIVPDGTRAVSGSADGMLKVWDLQTGQLLHTLSGHTHHISGVAITPDGARAVSASWDNTLKVWDLQTGQVLYTLSGHTHNISAVAVTPDGAQAISASHDNTLKMWDLQTGQLLLTLSGHIDEVWRVNVTSNGKWAVSGSRDSTLKVWDLQTGQLLHTLSGHTRPVSVVAVTPDGTRAVSGSYDTTLKVWDLQTGQLLQTLSGHTGALNAVAVTPDGTRVVSGSADTTLKVWDISAFTAHRAASQPGTVIPPAIEVSSSTPQPGKASLAERLKKLREAGERQRAEAEEAERRRRGEEFAALRELLVEQLDAESYADARGTVTELLKLKPDDREAKEAQALIFQQLAGTGGGGAVVILPGGVEMEFVQILPGTFMMGSPETEPGRLAMEGPQHEVTLTKGFWLGKYPVTQAQWQAVMGNNPSQFQGDDQRPVEQVSWNDCQQFLQRVAAQGDGDFRLPTEAEWEYACRAGTRTAYSFGNDAAQLGEHAWCMANSSQQTKPVGQKTPNAWGLHDMHGNVNVWCSDWFDDYRSGLATDPQGATSGESRVLRGGSWSAAPWLCRSAVRLMSAPALSWAGHGFRVVRVSR